MSQYWLFYFANGVFSYEKPLNLVQQIYFAFCVMFTKAFYSKV